MVFQVTLAACAGSAQPSFFAADSLTPTVIGDSMILSWSFTRDWPCGSLSRYLALANQAACASVRAVSTASVLSIVPPKVNRSFTPVAFSTMPSRGWASFRSLVASTLNAGVSAGATAEAPGRGWMPLAGSSALLQPSTAHAAIAQNSPSRIRFIAPSPA